MEIKNIKFDFDDVLIVPETITEINSRYRDVHLLNKLPLFTAPMDTVVGLDNMLDYLQEGISVVLPRTITYYDFVMYLVRGEIITDEIKDAPYYRDVFISLGLDDIKRELKDGFDIYHDNAKILIDVANAHMNSIYNIVEEIHTHRPDIELMIGNIANPETYRKYAEQGIVRHIRVGIGAGGGCLTSKMGSVGYPMGSLINEIRAIKEEMMAHGSLESDLPQIIADGGMRDYSDIIKSLALGADKVMVGSIFNKAIESSGKNYLWKIPLSRGVAKYLFKKGLPIRKYFRGMSTKAAQKAMGKTELKTSEGVIRYRKAQHTISGWSDNFKHYLRSSMSYTNSPTLTQYIGGVRFVLITNNAYNRFNK
jgi:IMP dehydrogenase/GMP reductase